MKSRRQEAVPEKADDEKENAQRAERAERAETALKLQSILRANKVRRAVDYIVLLEDEFLKLPTPGIIAAEKLLREFVVDGVEEPMSEAMVTAGRWGSERPGSSSSRKPVSESGSRRAASKESAQRGSSVGSHKSGGAGQVVPQPKRLGTIVPEGTLARRLEEAGVEDPTKAARYICWLLCDPEPLDSFCLERVCQHHRLRRKNQLTRVILRLTLVCHGHTVQKGKLVGELTRPLAPDGWAQVTRTGWALRLHPEFTPGLILTSTETSCEQTAGRVRSVLGDDSDDDLEPEPTPPPGGAPERRPRPPAPRTCEALTFPGYWKSLGPESYRVFDTVADMMTEWDTDADLSVALSDKPPDPPIPIMLVGCGHMLETALACLTANSRRNDELAGRWGGGGKVGPGDAIVVQSPPLCSMTGEELTETYKLASTLWREALTRANWQVVKHIRGSGRPSERPSVKTANGYISADDADKIALAEQLEAQMAPLRAEEAEIFDEESAGGEDVGDGTPKSKDEEREGSRHSSRSTPSRKPRRKPIDPMFVSDFGLQWRKYAGEPLIMSHGEFSRLVVRGGSKLRPPAVHTVRALRPLVRDVSLETVEEEDSKSNASSGAGTASRQQRMGMTTGSLPSLRATRNPTMSLGSSPLLSHRSNRSSRSSGSRRSNRASGFG